MKLTVIRNRGWYGRWRSVKLMADSVEIGRLRAGETVEVVVPAGARALYARMDWGQSPPYALERVREGQTVYVNAAFTLDLLRGLGLAPIPLRLEDAPRPPRPNSRRPDIR